jgi:hypothetical protein
LTPTSPRNELDAQQAQQPAVQKNAEAIAIAAKVQLCCGHVSCDLPATALADVHDLVDLNELELD